MVVNKKNLLRIDGLSNFFRVDLIILKIAWIFIFFCSASACFYFVVNEVLTFAKFQVVTTFRMQTPTKAVFPTIIICNQNPLNSNYFVQLLNLTNMTANRIDQFYNLLSLESAHKNITGAYLTEEQKIALFDWDGFIISCKFGNKDCNSTNFRRFYFPYYLNCLLFNSGRNQNSSNEANVVEFEEVSAGGDAFSLTMELYVGLPNQLTPFISKRGILVNIIDSNDDPIKNSPSPISITPGLATEISVKRSEYNLFNKWPYLYNECTVNKDGTLMQPLDDYTLYDYAISTNFKYTRGSCVLYCFNIVCAQQCNCSSL